MTFYRRNLPHWHPEAKTIFVTWRLYGSLPRGLGGTATPGCADKNKSTGKSARATAGPHATKWGREFRRMDAVLDRGAFGPVWLRDPEIAGIAERAIRRGQELEQYILHAYVVMPNHVHVLLAPLLPLARITGGIKGVSARDANSVLGLTGKHFWQDESFDHWVRNVAEFERIRLYIEYNPVMGGWSSGLRIGPGQVLPRAQVAQPPPAVLGKTKAQARGPVLPLASPQAKVPEGEVT